MINMAEYWPLPLEGHTVRNRFDSGHTDTYLTTEFGEVWLIEHNQLNQYVDTWVLKIDKTKGIVHEVAGYKGNGKEIEHGSGYPILWSPLKGGLVSVGQRVQGSVYYESLNWYGWHQFNLVQGPHRHLGIDDVIKIHFWQQFGVQVDDPTKERFVEADYWLAPNQGMIHMKGWTWKAESDFEEKLII